MAPNTPVPATAMNAVIDLCGDADGNEPAEEYAKSMVESLSKRKRKSPRTMSSSSKNHQQDSRKKAPTRGSAAAATISSSSSSSTPDAIEIDLGRTSAASASSMSQDPAAIYRSQLGPFRFDFVDSFQNKGAHSFQKSKQAATLNTNKLYKELIEYQLNLPIELSSSIFVRVCESRLDLIRAMITGPEGTPYANGCFFFDIHMSDYPSRAPSVKFLTTGQGRVRFNPNLYNCGKVCLSLLGTWAGPGWMANKSTLLQVLVSIQGLILVPDPFYNEPGFEKRKGQKAMEKQSDAYTKNIRRYTLQHGMDDYLKKATTAAAAYPEFSTVVTRHFVQRAAAIEAQLDEWSAEDVAIRTVAESVRKNLRALVALDSMEQEQQQKAAAAAAAAKAAEIVTIDEMPNEKPRAVTAAMAKGPPEIVTID